MYQLFESAQLGPLTLKNRILRSATNEHLSEPDGSLSQAWADTMTELARGGTGLILTGHMTVDGNYRSDAGQPVLDSRADPALLSAAAEAVHAQNGRLAVQLSHCGPKADPAVTGFPPKAPADFTREELNALKERFATAARICQTAGLDGVQVHCAHGYLLSAFLNPTANLRSDEYGGRLENRFRIVGEILRGIRSACGSRFALLVKVDCDGCGDLPRLVELVRDAGADAAEISGLGFNAHAGEKFPFFLNEALDAQRAGLPLILVGGIFRKQDAQAVLDAGIPFVSLCRALICQPDLPVRWMAGEEEAACTACNGCFRIYRQRHVRCVQHKEEIPQLARVFPL